jgi:hypothetical protein
MAFNPFRAFRKHQKVLFAALTILCMFVFVLSGASGFFQEWQHWFTGRGRIPEVATVYGKPVDERDLLLLRQQRELANMFMVEAIQRATLNAGLDVERALTERKLDPQTQQLIREALGFRQNYVKFDPQRGIAFYQADPTFYTYLQFIPQLLQNLIGRLEQTRAILTAQDKPEEATLLQQLADVLQQDVWILQRNPRDMYFGGSRDPKDLIDFLVWKGQADRLGIQLTNAEVDELVTRETRRFLRDASTQIFKDLRRRFPNLTRDSLHSALADEFRVRLAQEALLGQESGSLAPVQQDAVTPYEFWKFYRQNRTESDIVLASIPVDQPAFLNKVGPPTEKELRSLFEANKDREPNPASDQAGFKQPRRIQAQWVSAPVDSPLYRKAADVEIAAIRATMPLAYELALVHAYDLERYKYPVAAWVSGRFLPEVQSIHRPENVVAAVGQSAAGVLPPLSAIATHTASATVRELRSRSAKAAGLVSGVSLNPVMALAAAYAGTPKDEYLPFDAVKERLATKLHEDMTNDLARGSLNAVRDYLSSNARAKSEDVRKFMQSAGALCQVLADGVNPGTSLLAPAAYNSYAAAGDLLERQRLSYEMVLGAAAMSPWARAAVAVHQEGLADQVIRTQLAELIQRYGLEQGSTTRPRDRFEIVGDEGLERLREAHAATSGGAAGTQGRQFASQFFEGGGQSARYQPQPLGDKFLFWRISEEPAYVPTFEEARPKVEARWKFEKARKLALDEVEKVAAEARKAKGDAEKNIADAANKFGRFIVLDKVARLKPRPSMVPSRLNFDAKSYEPYQVPSNDVEYPSKGFVDKLLDLKERGDVTVLHDAPEATYYVAALTHRAEPFELTFVDDARNPDMLLEYWERETKSQQKFRQGCIEELRQEARLRYNDDELERMKSPGSIDEE